MRGRAWDVLYWSGVVVLVGSGLVVSQRRIGLVLLTLGLVIAVLAPVRGQPERFWPVLGGFVGFVTVGSLAAAVSSTPVVVGLIAGLAAAALGAYVAHRITAVQRRLEEEERSV